MSDCSEFNLPVLTRWTRAKLLGFAQQVLQAQQEIHGQEGRNILYHTLEEKKRHVQMAHCPEGDRIDHATGAQYFYHCHRENFHSEEHGHFHCFMRYKNIPRYLKPLTPPVKASSLMTHLIAIGMNRHGQPIRLFTVNRWITSDIWYQAKHTSLLLKRFKIKLEDPYWQVLDKWVEGILHLFSPQINWLLEKRDEFMRAYPGGLEFLHDDRNLEELSSLPIDLAQQVNWILNR